VAQRAYLVPGEDFFLAYGVGRLWAWGNPGVAGASTTLSSLNPSSGAVRRVRLGPGVGLTSVAFAKGSAWFTEPAQNRVLLVGRVPVRFLQTIVVPKPEYAVTVDPLTILVSDASGALRELPSYEVADAREAFPTLLSQAPALGLWFGHGKLLDYQRTLGTAPSVELRLAHPVSAVAGDPVTGVYVATKSSSAQNYGPYLVYYSGAAATSRLPEASAQLGGHVRIESMAAEPGGGVVFVTSDGVVASWNPAGDG
jgi:hypothetical protein